MGHIGVVSWDYESFSKSFPSVLSATQGYRKIVCCNPADSERYAEFLQGSGAFLLSPKSCEAILGTGHGTTIGHCRNIIQAASYLVDGGTPLVFFDDDVFPGPATMETFQRSLEKYDLVQGQYIGDVANSLHLAVHFLGILENAYSKSDEMGGEWLGLASDCIRGKFTYKAAPVLKGAAGGVLGIGPRLALSVAFAPTPYRIEDHFFEFYCRFFRKELSFMGEKTAAAEIPFALHGRKRRGHPALASSYAFELKSTVVEKYLYFRTTGMLPKVVGGRHALSRAEDFDVEEMAILAAEEGALGKIQGAAQFYLKKNPPGEIAAELERLLGLSYRDFLVSQSELQQTFSDFAKEQEALAGLRKTTEKEAARMKEELDAFLV